MVRNQWEHRQRANKMPPHRIVVDGLSATGFISMLPNAALAIALGITWVAPETFGEKTVKWALALMLLEFICLHGSVFLVNVWMGGEVVKDPANRLPAALGLSLFYTLFAWAFAMGLQEWWVIWAFWLLILNRSLNVVLAADKQAAMQGMLGTWGLSTAIYLLAVMLTTLLPSIPEMGINSSVIAAQDFGNTGGLWIREPERVVVAGMLYFAGNALLDLFGVASEPITKETVPDEHNER